MTGLRMRLPNTKSQGKFPRKLRVGQEEVAARIEPLHQSLIRRIARAQPKADEIEHGGRGQFEARVIPHPSQEFLRQTNVFANVMLQTFNSIMPDHKP